MSRIFEMVAGAVIDAEGRTVVNGVVSIYDAETGGNLIPPTTLRQADGSAWPIEGVKTDGNGKVKVLWPDSAGAEPDDLFADTQRGRWRMPPADISLRVANLEANPGGGANITGGGVTADTWVTATAYTAGRIIAIDGKTYFAKNSHTSGATFAGDLSAHWAVAGLDPATAAQVVIADDGTAAGFRTTVGGMPGLLPLIVGTFVPDGGGGGDGSDWQTVATYRWTRAGLPAVGTDIDGLHWTGASGNPDLVGAKIGAGGAVVTTYHGVKYLEGENVQLSATLPAAFSSSPGSAPAAVLMRFARLGPLGPINLLTSFFLRVGGVHLALQYQDARTAGQKLVWAVFLPDSAVVFPVTSGIDQSGAGIGASGPHLLVDVVIRVEFDGASSKLYANGVLQFTFDATTTPSTAFTADNIDFGDPSFRGTWAVSDIIVMPSDATPARVTAAAATIPAGA